MKSLDNLPKSTLSSIVESSNLDLIVHPTISCLIDIKWKKFGRLRAWLDFFLTIIYVAVWVTFAVWVPYNERHHYDFGTHSDRFRFCLFVSFFVNKKNEGNLKVFTSK